MMHKDVLLLLIQLLLLSAVYDEKLYCGLSIGLDKPNGLAKLSKRELIQKVNAVEAENDALEDRVAKLEALVAQLASK